jgi:hypothetical protein
MDLSFITLEFKKNSQKTQTLILEDVAHILYEANIANNLK